MAKFIVAIIVLQFILGDLALAQSSTSGSVNPNDSSLWFNDPSGSSSGASTSSSSTQGAGSGDPWGSSGSGSSGSGMDDPWGNSGSSGMGAGSNSTWGDMGSDPGLGGYFGNSGYMAIRPTNSFWGNLLRYTGALNKDYTGIVNTKRSKAIPPSTMDPDDYVADQIIKEHAGKAALLGFGAATIPFLFDYVWKEWRTNISNIGYGIGVAVGAGLDFMSVIRIQTSMMLELSEVYNELPSDEDERADIATLPFVVGLSDAAINKFVAHTLLLEVAPPPLPPGGDPGTFGGGLGGAGGWGGNPSTPFAGEITGEPLPKLAQPAAQEATEVAKQITEKVGFGKRLVTIVKSPKAALEFAQSMPPLVKVISAALLAAGVDAGTTMFFGKRAKKFFKAMRKKELANIIQSLRSRAEAKKLIWLVLTKDVFKDMPVDQAKTYAAVIQHEFPLVRNTKWDEVKDLFDTFRENPKIIDQYMITLRNDQFLDVSARLYLIKLVLGGMLVKGGLSDHDTKTLNILGMGLGLVPPTNTNFNMASLRAGDIRRVNKAHFDQMVSRMEQAVLIQEQAKTKDNSKAHKKNPQMSRWPKASQVILEEYEDNDVPEMLGLYDDIMKKSAVSSQDEKTADKVASDLLNGDDNKADVTDPKAAVKTPEDKTSGGKNGKPGSIKKKGDNSKTVSPSKTEPGVPLKDDVDWFKQPK